MRHISVVQHWPEKEACRKNGDDGHLRGMLYLMDEGAVALQAPRGQKAEMKRVVSQAPPREGQKSICDFGEYSVIFQSGNLAQTSRRTVRFAPGGMALQLRPSMPCTPTSGLAWRYLSRGCLLGAVSCNQQVSFLPLPMPLLPAILNLGMGFGMLTLFICCCCLSHVFEKEKMPLAPEIRVRSPGHVKAVLSPDSRSPSKPRQLSPRPAPSWPCVWGELMGIGNPLQSTPGGCHLCRWDGRDL